MKVYELRFSVRKVRIPFDDKTGPMTTSWFYYLAYAFVYPGLKFEHFLYIENPPLSHARGPTLVADVYIQPEEVIFDEHP